jgi:hypothetical protein
MRNIFLATIGLLALLAAGAVAGDYHYKTTLNCADCHIMHASQSHGYNTDGGGTFTPYTTTPNEGLLRDEVNKLCLGCHDNQAFAPDVFLENGGTAMAHGRQAGALNEVGNGTPYYEATGHTLGSKANAPGGTAYVPDATTGLECTNCHGAHGNTNFRNLGSHGATVSVTYTAGGSPDITKDVWEVAAHSYDTWDVNFLEPDPTKSAYGAFCQNCHTDFHGSTNTTNMFNMTDSAWVRHPTADVNIRMVSSSTGNARQFAKVAYRTKVMSPTGDWGIPGTALGKTTTLTSLTPSCFSCHKGHGSSHAFGLIYMTGTVEPGEDGDGTAMKTTCQQCHSQGV